MKNLVFVLAAVALLAAPLMASVVFSDDFSDGNRDGWFINNDDEFNDVTVNAGGAMVLSDTDATQNIFSAVGNFAAADLSLVGAKISLSLVFQNLENHPSYRGLGIGLYDSAGTVLTSDVAQSVDGLGVPDGLGVGDDDSGWYLYTRRYPALHRIYENNGGGISYDLGASRASDNQSTFGYADGIWHTYKLEIEAVADLPDDGYDDLEDFGIDHLVTIICDEGMATESIMTYRDKFTLIVNYDEVGIESMKGLDVMVDNVMVDYVEGVPEPATLGLLGLGCLFLRRRK